MRNQPSTRVSAVSTGSPSYLSKSIGPRSAIRPSVPMRTSTPSSGTPSYTQPPAVSLEPYVATTRTPADSARRRRSGSIGPPPSRIVSKRRSRAASDPSRRWSWVGTSDVYSRVPAGGDHRESIASRPSTGSNPASSDRTTTCSPATYDGGSASTHNPGPPSRSVAAAAEASTADRDSTTRLGAPVEPEVSISRWSGSSAASQSRTRRDGVGRLVAQPEEAHATHAIPGCLNDRRCPPRPHWSAGSPPERPSPHEQPGLDRRPSQ